jgi:hypothetical protein
VFENRVLRRVFGSKRDEVTGDWRKMHNEELHNLYSSSSIIGYSDQVKEDEIGGACSTNGGEEEYIQDIGGKARRKGTTAKTKT